MVWRGLTDAGSNLAAGRIAGLDRLHVMFGRLTRAASLLRSYLGTLFLCPVLPCPLCNISDRDLKSVSSMVQRLARYIVSNSRGYEDFPATSPVAVCLSYRSDQGVLSSVKQARQVGNLVASQEDLEPELLRGVPLQVPCQHLETER